ncbi:Dynein heavy chain 8, axonemal, partial [Dryobates pubescens]
RERRRKKIDALYKYIFEILSVRLGLDLPTVEEMILDAPSFEAFDSFFAKGGSKALKIFYQEGDAPGIECGRTIAGLGEENKMMQFYVDDTPDTFVGLCLFFVRCRNDSPINMKTIHEDIFFGVLDATEGLLRGVKKMIGKVFLPAILATNNWGTLNQAKQVTKEKQIFVEKINKYLSFLEGAILSIEGTVELKKVDDINFSKLQSFERITAAANNPDMVHQLEEVLMMWYKQIEQVLMENKLTREEVDSDPLSELEYWKFMSAKFNFIIEQIQGPNCKAVINVLNVGHSKLLRMWQDLEARITDAANESKDNVKYLRTLEKVCQPLYSYDVVMTRGIPNLINAIRMIHNVSRYYNTSERMTPLFIKVTNQMITTCRAHITDGGLSCIWEQETSTVTEKIKDCIFLLKEYQKCFQEAKNEILESLGERRNTFEGSEMHINRKSEAFCRRLEKITEIITVVETFSALSLSTIEGIDAMAVKFNKIYQSVQKKKYDILDLRKRDFDVDFVAFMTKIQGLEMQIQAFMRTCFERILSSQHALQLLQRFQNLRMPCLQEETVHTIGCILQHYVGELEATKKLYEIQKDAPPLPRNMPPVAGKILWARQLFRRINEPISYFHKKSDILASPEGKAVVQLYNRIAYVLVEFEIIYHHAWMKEMSQLQHPLQATVFVRHPETGNETKCMIKLGLEIPEQAKKIVKLENNLKSIKTHLEDLIQSYEELCQETPNYFANIMAPKMQKMEAVLRQGLTMLTWSSVSLESFFQEADQVLYMYRQFLKKVNDLSEVKIDLILEEISNTLLIVLPADGPTEVENMLTCNEAYTEERAELLNQKSMRIEDAVQELISVFEKHYEIKLSKEASEKHVLPVQEKHIAFEKIEEERENNIPSSLQSDNNKDSDKEDEFKKKCKELVAYFSHQLLESLQKATQLSLDSLKKRI